jgi:hypothetical protein
MDNERAAFIAAMYREEPKRQPTQRVETPAGKSRKIRVGIVEYEVPTMAYVETLERLVAIQGVELVRQKRLLNSLLDDRVNTRNTLNRQSGAMRDVRAQMDTKIGRTME